MTNYPVPYQNNWGYSGIPAQMYPQTQAQPVQQPQQNSGMGIKWVDGEVGAKAYQMPNGWPPNQPIALWDTNDTVIYLKSTNPMGMPNPLQKAHYRLEGTGVGEKSQGYSGEVKAAPEADMSAYVKKSDLEKMKQDLMDAIGTMSTSGTGVRKTAAKGE